MAKPIRGGALGAADYLISGGSAITKRTAVAGYTAKIAQPNSRQRSTAVRGLSDQATIDEITTFHIGLRFINYSANVISICFPNQSNNGKNRSALMER
jgi:hypothetical protein